jgi:hypothetical protein
MNTQNKWAVLIHLLPIPTYNQSQGCEERGKTQMTCNVQQRFPFPVFQQRSPPRSTFLTTLTRALLMIMFIHGQKESNMETFPQGKQYGDVPSKMVCKLSSFN